MKMTSPAGVGVITVLTVLLVLSLSILSALSLASARADLALSQRAADLTQDYYAAEARALESVRAQKAMNAPFIEGRETINERQTLEYALMLGADGDYRVTRWQMVPDTGDEGFDFLDVFMGDLLF